MTSAHGVSSEPGVTTDRVSLRAGVVPVWTHDTRYRVAVAELPLRTMRADGPAGAIVVVGGGAGGGAGGSAGWIAGARDAAAGGARGIVIAEPADAAASDVRALAASLAVPLVVERTFLRADIAADAVAARSDGSGDTRAPALVVVDGGAPAAALGVLTRDAVGWARTLAGGALTLVGEEDGPVLLQTDARMCAALTVVATDRPGAGWLRASALGDPVVDVEIEGAAMRTTRSDAAGRLILPPRWESSARAALRRVLDALEEPTTGPAPDDLSMLADDSDLSRRILAHRRG